jgi:hypothetical protein
VLHSNPLARVTLDHALNPVAGHDNTRRTAAMNACVQGAYQGVEILNNHGDER